VEVLQFLLFLSSVPFTVSVRIAELGEGNGFWLLSCH